MNDELGLAFIGFGNVGRAFADLLHEKRVFLEEQYSLSWKVVAISTAHHGVAVDPKGLDLKRAVLLYEGGSDLGRLSKEPAPGEYKDLIQTSGAQVLFENTPVDYHTGQPAVDHIRIALQSGLHVITANKGPVALAYKELSDLAQEHEVKFLFESTVMDGAPIFSLWREALPGAKLHEIRGVLNSTTNMILGLMEQGRSFDEALAYTQAIGIAETDPSGDIDGWDAAVKLAALINVLMGIAINPAEVNRQGIRSITNAKIQHSANQGKRWKLICEAKIDGGRVRCAVSPQELGPSDPLYQVQGTSSSVTFKSDVLGDLTILEESPGPKTTAYGLLADFINALRRR